MLGISQRDLIRDDEINARTTVADIEEEKTKNRQTQVARYIDCSTNGRWGQKVLEWRPRTGRCSIGRLPIRWSNDFVVGTGLMRMAQDRSVRRTLWEAFVQKWTSFG